MLQNSLKTFTENQLIDCMLSSNVIKQCGAICEIVRRYDISGVRVSSRVTDIIKRLQNDMTPFWNMYTVSDFAVAALCIVTNSTYTGDKDEINKLLAVKLRFD